MDKQEKAQKRLEMLSAKLNLQTAIENDPKLSLVVPDVLTDPDELIVDAKRSLTQFRVKDLNGGIAYTATDEINISVAPGNIGRALRFMDTFIKIIRVRGYQIKIENNITYVVINDEKVEIYFREKRKKIKVRQPHSSWESTEYHSTGILSFQMKIFYDETEWKDGSELLESKLSSILAKMELKVKEHIERKLLREIENEEYERKAQIKREFEKRKEKELSDFNSLLKQAERWHKTVLLRNYIDEIEKSSIDKLDWVLWARKKADWYDPQIEAEDELLQNVNRETLSFEKKQNSIW